MPQGVLDEISRGDQKAAQRRLNLDRLSAIYQTLPGIAERSRLDYSHIDYFGYSGNFVWHNSMNYDNDLFVDEVIRECWDHKAQIAAEYPIWEFYRARQQKERKRLEAEGWKFAYPCSNIPEPITPAIDKKGK